MLELTVLAFEGLHLLGNLGRDAATLAKAFGRERLDAACSRALEINAHSYTSLHSILKNGLDRQRREPTTDGPAITHPNIRGADYFH